MTDAATAIHNLLFRYAELIDAGDFDGLADLLGGAAIGSGDAGPTLTGHDAVLAMFTSTTRRYPDGTPGTKHVTTNVILELDEETGSAAARSYFTVLQAVPGLPLQPILAGRYHDRFASDGGSWHFTERRYLIDLTGNLSHHTLGPLPDTGN